MDDTRIELVIPRHLRRRINRFIQIDDILNEQKDEQNNPLDPDVCLIWCLFF